MKYKTKGLNIEFKLPLEKLSDEAEKNKKNIRGITISTIDNVL